MIPEFNTLILLIGTNPLPNFVVTQYFIKKSAKLNRILLIHSESAQTRKGTHIYAEKIIELVKKKNSNPNLTFHLIGLSDISNPSTIWSDLQRRLPEKLRNTDLIHLNYTGGTKSMGIQLFKFLLEKCPDRSTFSYLDARTFRIVFHNEREHTGDLRKHINLSIEEVLFLHNFRRINEPDQDSKVFNEAVKVQTGITDVSG